MKNNNTCVLKSVMFYEIRQKSLAKYFRVLGCDIYTIIDDCLCIDYLACQSKELSDIFIGRKYLGILKRILGYRHSRFLINLLSYHSLMKNINSNVVLLSLSWILEYYFSKGFVIL